MLDTIIIGNNQIDKHINYKDKYPKNKIFWGLGIENELYLQFDIKNILSKDKFKNNHKRERYSVDYFSNYNKVIIEKAFDELIKNLNQDQIQVIILLNAHSFQKTDFENNAKTTYTNNPQPNPKFNTNTLIEKISELNNYFLNTEGTYWLFDGDTIEIVTLNFSNNKILNVIEELETNKKIFELELKQTMLSGNIFTNYGQISFMKENYPWATYMTNLNNIGMFNNGTLHYNITLPTELDSDSNIINKIKFIKDHQHAIKIIQWFEPFIIAMYGSPDPFANLTNPELSNKFSASSQRCAVSRYIGIGIYDSDKMIPGKLLHIPISELDFSSDTNWWYNKYHSNSAYNKLDQIGLDINFNKHYSHGIELRFLDHISSREKIYESWEFIIYLIDWAFDETNVLIDLSNPIRNQLWNNLVTNILIYGREYKLRPLEIEYFKKLFGISFNSVKLYNVYYKILNTLKISYSKIFVEKINVNNDLDIPKYKFTLKPNGYFSKLVLEDFVIDYNNHDLYNICIDRLDKCYTSNDLNVNTNTNTQSNIINKKKYNDYNEKIDKQLENKNCCSSCFAMFNVNY